MSIKQVIIIRTDLNMRKGKMIAQGSHASMKVFFDRMGTNDSDAYDPYYSGDYYCDFTPEMIEWKQGNFTKIVVGVNSLQELLELEKQANDAGIVNAIITDLGLTEFKDIPTITCLAIGPDKSEKIDKITSHLKLL